MNLPHWQKFSKRCMGVLTFKTTTYEEIKEDRDALNEAFFVVILNCVGLGVLLFGVLILIGFSEMFIRSQNVWFNFDGSVIYFNIVYFIIMFVSLYFFPRLFRFATQLLFAQQNIIPEIQIYKKFIWYSFLPMIFYVLAPIPFVGVVICIIALLWSITIQWFSLKFMLGTTILKTTSICIFTWILYLMCYLLSYGLLLQIWKVMYPFNSSV